MKSAVVIIITIVIVVLGVIVALTLVLGGREKSGESPSTLRSGEDGGMYVSEDAGITWRQRVEFSEKSTIGGIDINDIVFHPQDDTKVFAASVGNSVFVSATGESDWIRLKDQNGILADAATVYQIAFDVADPEYLYLAVTYGGAGKVLRSSDGGNSFEQVYQTPQAAGGSSAVYSVAVDPENSARIYTSTAEGGLLSSENRGESWSVVHWFSSPVRKLYIHPQDPNFMYVTFLGKDIAKIARSYDHGKTWENLIVAPPKKQRITGIYDLTFHPTDANILYLATSAGVFKTPDAGATWQEFPLIIPASLLPVFAVAVDPWDPAILYIAAASQLYKSKDGGASWEVRQLPTSRSIRVLVFSPKSSDILWAGLRGASSGKSSFSPF